MFMFHPVSRAVPIYGSFSSLYYMLCMSHSIGILILNIPVMLF